MIDRLLFHPINIIALIRFCNISKYLIVKTISPYYFFTFIYSLLDGITSVLFVGLFTNGFTLEKQEFLPEPIILFLGNFIAKDSPQSFILLMLSLFTLSLFLKIGLSVTDGFISSYLREKIQKNVFRKYLKGDWAYLRSFRVGEAVGTTTLESMTTSKYLSSALITFYHLISCTVMASLALWTSFKVTFYLFILVLPLIAFILFIFKKLAKISKQHAFERNLSSANITDRYNGLQQIHIDNKNEYHFRQGMQQMPVIMKLEIQTYLYQSLVGSLNILLPLIALSGLSAWIYFYGLVNFPALGLIASIGVLGIKFSSHLTSLISMVGNLYRLSGSIYPILKARGIPKNSKRIQIKNKVKEIELNRVSYSYGKKHIFKDITFNIKYGMPVLLFGKSGAGKTTIANLVSGLYFPREGVLNYIDDKKKKYSSKKHIAKIGFVTQDVYFFQGTLKENLTSGRNISEKEIWKVLKQVDAVDFVKKMGGLKAESAEAGRSMSGGQKRRLGIARVLLMGADVLILDEVTAGLDPKNKKNVIKIITLLSKKYPILIISHESLKITNMKIIKV